jgi:hypothetical protein
MARLVIYVCNPDTWEVKIRRIVIQGQPGQGGVGGRRKKLSRPQLNQKVKQRAPVCHPAMSEALGRRTVIQGCPWEAIKDPI